MVLACRLEALGPGREEVERDVINQIADRLAEAVQSICGKLIPVARLPDQCAFEALRALGRAYAKAGAQPRGRLTGPLATVAGECAELLGPVASPAPCADPLQRPGRALLA